MPRPDNRESIYRLVDLERGRQVANGWTANHDSRHTFEQWDWLLKEWLHRLRTAITPAGRYRYAIETIALLTAFLETSGPMPDVIARRLDRDAKV